MKNIERLLAALEAEGMNKVVGEVLLAFLKKMDCGDIKEGDINEIAGAVDKTKFGSGLDLDEEWLTGKFKEMAPQLLSESSVRIATDPEAKVLDLSRIFFIYILIHNKLRLWSLN